MPGDDAPLAGLRVLVTRPRAQAHGLMARVRGAGGEPVPFPTLEILARTPEDTAAQALASADTVIFVSANAVAHGYPLLQALPTAGRHVIAIGAATKTALEQAGCSGVSMPPGAATSEGLAALAELGKVTDRRICIVRGEGGRDWLRQSLTARGARVSYLECYRRRRPAKPRTGTLIRALETGTGGLVITTTSTAGLANLLAMTPTDHAPRLTSRPLVVIGDRQRRAALEHGWDGPVLVATAGDDSIVDTIVAWRSVPAR